MGVQNNECVIATTWDEKVIPLVRDWISTLADDEQSVFVIVDSVVNEKTTIFMGPDGSKKGWDTAIRFEKVRDAFIEFLTSFDYDDESNPFDFIEVGYGEYGQKVLRGNCTNCYGDEDYAI